MSTFKEITENTITNNGESISGRLVYNWFTGTESKPVYFGLKDDAGSWAGNLSTKGTSAFYLTSNVSGCTAQVKDSTAAPSTADANTAREIFLNIPSTTTSRTIQFSYNGTTLITVKQTIVIPNKLLICKPIWTKDPDTITSNTTIGFSTKSDSIRSISFNGYGGNNLKKMLCAIEQLNSIHTVTWSLMQVQNISPLTYISGRNFKTNGMGDYWLLDVKVDTGNEIVTDYDKIQELDILYIFVPNAGSGKPINVGYVIMSTQKSEYMLAEL